ncbi:MULTISPECIES: HAH_0734 family protein [Halostella]|uniref:HAH_0734 family protein n=1 Tax=Halostella TaxID=1843185 RepID=UPI0010822807|nr:MULTISPECIES: HAH_0734 family protein [Halostella]
MKRLIVSGDPGIRKDAIIEYDGEEQIVFQINRQGEWHGPEEPQIWCIIGTEDEREAFETRDYIPHWLDVERIESEALDVVKAKSDLSV